MITEADVIQALEVLEQFGNTYERDLFSDKIDLFEYRGIEYYYDESFLSNLDSCYQELNREELKTPRSGWIDKSLRYITKPIRNNIQLRGVALMGMGWA